MNRLACLALALCSSVAYADAPKLHPGQWTFTFGIQGSDGTAMMPPQTEERCLTAEQAKDPTKQVKFPPGCEASNVKQEGSMLRWDLVCHMGGGTQTGSGTVTYSSDAMTNDGAITIEIPNHGKRTMKMHGEGKRLGECK